MAFWQGVLRKENAEEIVKRLQMRGKRKTTGNRTYGAYSISLTHLALESGDVDDPSALDLDSHFAVDMLHSYITEQGVSNSTEHDLIALRATLTQLAKKP